MNYPEYTTYGKSCLDLKSKNPNAKSGYYEIFTAGNIVNVYCEQEKENGGWTQVAAVKLDKAGVQPAIGINDLGLNYKEVMFISCKNHWAQYATHAYVWKSKGYTALFNYLQFSGKKYYVKHPSAGWNAMPGQTIIPLTEFRRMGPKPNQCYMGDQNVPDYCFYQFVFQSKGKLEAFGDVESTTGQWTGDNQFHYDFRLYVR